jgi:uncharacterized protein (TIGR02246 family)
MGEGRPGTLEITDGDCTADQSTRRDTLRRGSSPNGNAYRPVGGSVDQHVLHTNQKGNIMTSDKLTENVLNVIRAVYDAWADNNAEAFAALYTDDATVVQPGVYKRGKDEIRTTMAAGFAGPLKGSRVHDEPQSIRFLGPEAAVVITEGGVLMAGQTDLASERLVRATWVPSW